MSDDNQFKMTRDPNGTLSISIKSAKIEAFFAAATGGRTERYTLGTGVHIIYIHDGYNYKGLTNIFSSRPGIPIIPSFHNYTNSDIVYSDNRHLINMNPLYIKGLASGVTINYKGLFSNERMDQIGKAFKMAMDYLINDSKKARIVKFNIIQADRSSAENVEVLHFPAVVNLEA